MVAENLGLAKKGIVALGIGLKSFGTLKREAPGDDCYHPSPGTEVMLAQIKAVIKTAGTTHRFKTISNL